MDDRTEVIEHQAGLEPRPLSERAASMFEFLADLQRLKTRVTRNIKAYRTVLWLHDLPRASEIVGAHLEPEASAWLSIDRVERQPPPTPPDVLAPWLTTTAVRDSHAARPRLSASIVHTIEVIGDDGEPTSMLEDDRLVDHPEVEEALEAWLPEWQTWAVDDRTRVDVARCYQELYAMYQDAHAMAELYELVLGFGLLTTVSGGQEVRRHLVTMKVAIELDLDNGRLTVIPAPDADGLELEQDMLDASDAPPEPVRQAVLRSLGDLESPWAHDPGGVKPVLRSWANGLSADTRFMDDLAPQAAARGETAVGYAPALVLRERTRKSFIAACERIIARIRTGTPVPSGVRQFVEITDGAVPPDEAERWSTTYADDETYFAKPSNDEQRQIVQRLASSQTVVVQGPPGTGKTHTIANLVTDLLAHGQRVLITSTTTRALSVLKGQLPPEVRDLCVSVTEDSVKGHEDLQRSVRTILGRSTESNPEAEDAEARTTRRGLGEARTREAEALRELRSIRELETYVYAPEIGSYQGTLQQIAGRVAEEEPRLSWLGPVNGDQPSIAGSHVRRYLSLTEHLSPSVLAMTGAIPPVTSVPRPDELRELAERRVAMLGRLDAPRRASTDAMRRALATLDPASRRAVKDGLSDLSARRGLLDRRTEAWVRDALVDVAGGREHSWRAKLDATSSAITSIETALGLLRGRFVTGLDALDLGIALGHVTALTAHLQAGKKLRGLLGPAKIAKEAEPFLDAVRVDGQRCESLETLAVVGSCIYVERRLRPVEAMWSAPVQPATSLDQRVAWLMDEVTVLAEVLELRRLRTVVDDMIHRSTNELVPADLGDPAEVAGALAAVQLIEDDETRAAIEARMRPAVTSLQEIAAGHGPAPAVGAAARALERWDADAYAEAYAAIGTAEATNTLLDELAALTRTVDSAAPTLRRALDANAEDVDWQQRCADLEQAWAWSVWDARIRDKTDPQAEERWRERLALAESDVRILLLRLASNRAWAYALRRLTSHEKTHLNLYATAVRKLGKGTGKYAPRHRESARRALHESQSAVPAWVMPMHQVFDTIPVDRPNLFDVVIVDEASQSGLEALLLSWLAPRMVIVGDDKQVSPSNVGLSHEDVYILQDRHLADNDTKDSFGPTYSFFDQAVAKSSARIMLREHFRCMPEIIGFSNSLCYDGQLVPLRQYGRDRLTPLRSTLVRGALVERGREVVNEAEAEQLVRQVAECCVDPAYDGKTMGVITLLGVAQDKLIMSMLVDELGVEQIESRRLRAGNAEAFQGDERHVIFMSMVSSRQSTTGPAMIGSLSKESDLQRLNVAASRAQDQVWLFHSVEPGELSSKDLRREYLQYVLRPPGEQDALDIGEVLPDRRHEAFDSLFEQQVFLALRSRGFRVRPQVRAGRYRIDLVVEGGAQRLAVECDGDAFHGVDEHADDAARQRDLERVGWTFWRVRGSAFYRDPRRALAPLWTALEELGIEPSSGASSAAVAVHDEVEARPTAVDPGQPDVIEALLDPEMPTEPADPAPAAEAVPAADDAGYAVAALESTVARVVPAETTSRFRDGRVILTPAARERIELEIVAAKVWLQRPVETSHLEARAADAARRRHDRRSEDQEERIERLERLLDQSITDPSHAGGSWITPGSVFWLASADEDLLRRHLISADDDAGHDDLELISPFSELGLAIDGALIGARITYVSPTGLRTVVVERIED